MNRAVAKAASLPYRRLPVGYLFGAPINDGRGAAFRLRGAPKRRFGETAVRPLHSPYFPGARGNLQRHKECAALKRRKRRAPFAHATPTLNTYPVAKEANPKRQRTGAVQDATARSTGSWSQCMRKNERGLCMNRTSQIRMTNDEIRRNTEIRMTNPAMAHPSAIRHSGFGILSSFVIFHLSFVMGGGSP